MGKREWAICWIMAAVAYVSTISLITIVFEVIFKGEDDGANIRKPLETLSGLVGVTGLPFLIATSITFLLLHKAIRSSDRLGKLMALGCGAAALISALTPMLSALGISIYFTVLGKGHLGVNLADYLSGSVSILLLGLAMGSPGILIFGPTLGLLLKREKNRFGIWIHQ